MNGRRYDTGILNRGEGDQTGRRPVFHAHNPDLTHSGECADDGLNFAQLDTMPSHLDLPIATAAEIDVAVGQYTCAISSPV
jgi:hypothetical protein